MPTVTVDLLDSKVTSKQKGLLAESLTEVVSKTLSYPSERVTIVFRRSAKSDIARGGRLG